MRKTQATYVAPSHKLTHGIMEKIEQDRRNMRDLKTEGPLVFNDLITVLALVSISSAVLCVCNHVISEGMEVNKRITFLCILDVVYIYVNAGVCFLITGESHKDATTWIASLLVVRVMAVLALFIIVSRYTLSFGLVYSDIKDTSAVACFIELVVMFTTYTCSIYYMYTQRPTKDVYMKFLMLVFSGTIGGLQAISISKLL